MAPASELPGNAAIESSCVQNWVCKNTKHKARSLQLQTEHIAKTAKKFSAISMASLISSISYLSLTNVNNNYKMVQQILKSIQQYGDKIFS